MRKLIWYGTASIATLLLFPNRYALGSETSAQAVPLRAHGLAYFRSGNLPTPPPVVYAYETGGKLLGIYGGNGHNGFGFLNALITDVDKGLAPAPTKDSKDASVDQAFKAYLKSQDISPTDLLKGTARYVLILVTPLTSPSVCGNCSYAYDQLSDAIARQKDKNNVALRVVVFTDVAIKIAP